MPQLNPAPWFAILVASWLVLLVLIVPKIMTLVFPNEPAPQDTEKSKGANWNWPWL